MELFSYKNLLKKGFVLILSRFKSLQNIYFFKAMSQQTVDK